MDNKQLHASNVAARAAEHSHEAAVFDELLKAAAAAQYFLAMARANGYAVNAAEVDRIEMRLYNALHPEAPRGR